MRALKVLVVVMGVLIVFGTVTLVVMVIQRASNTAARPGTAAADFTNLALNEPAGTRIVGMTATADRVALQLHWDGLDRVVFIDPKTNKATGQVVLGRFAPPAGPGP